MKQPARPFSVTCVTALVYTVLLSATGAVPAFAQEFKTLEPIEVVGTRVKRTDWETATPVHVITREDIRESGAVSVSDLFLNVPAATGGSIQDLSYSTGFSSGTATVSLRGLGSQATLILLNGRRIAPAPHADPNVGLSLLYNLNAIPLPAIERVEVLTGGASAIYGSDAMAGAINFVLRKDYQGAEAGVRYNMNQNGEFGNRNVHGFVGFGDPAKDGYNATIMFVNSRRDATRLTDTRGVEESELARLFNRNTNNNTASYPGNFFRESQPGNGQFTEFVGRDARCPPGLVLASGYCGYNPDQVLNTTGQQESNAISGQAYFPVRSGLSFFSEFGLSRVENRYVNPVRNVTEAGSTWYAQDGRRNLFRFILPAGHPDNPTDVPVALRYRFADVGPMTRYTSTDSGRLLLGAKGSHAGWDWESAFSYMRIDYKTTDRGNLYFPAIVDAIASGAYRPFGNNSAQTIAAISPSAYTSGLSTRAGWDLKGARKLMDMAGGPMTAVTGVEISGEQLRVDPDARTIAGDFIGLGGAQAAGKRLISSAFAELSAPFIRQVETQLALRFDHYSDYGNSTTPQLGLKWKPVDILALRASYAAGFRAPALSTIADANTQLFYYGLNDPLRCDKPGSTPEDCSSRSSAMIRANTGLKPERSHGQMLGLVFSPTSNFDLALDFYRIDRDSEITLPDPQFLINNYTRFPGVVIRNPDPATWLPGVPGSGPVESVIEQYSNLGRTITRGVDLDATLRTSLGAWGRLKTQFLGSYLIKFRSRMSAEDPYVDYQGGYGPSGELPRFRGSLATTWSYGGYSVTGRINYVSGWRYGDGANPCWTGNAAYLESYDCRIKPWSTADISVGYGGIKNLDIGVTVRNIQNKPAPLDSNPFYITPGFNSSFHNPYGRYLSLWMNYKFL